jgi:hypothetical protein
MAKPQQPELRRSARVPALDPDASEAELSGRDRPVSGPQVGDVPEEQRPGHHPEHEQDKPDLDAFAARLGVAREGEEPDGAPDVTGGDASSDRWQPQWQRLAVPAAVAVFALVAIVRRRRR